MAETNPIERLRAAVEEDVRKAIGFRVPMGMGLLASKELGAPPRVDWVPREGTEEQLKQQQTNVTTATPRILWSFLQKVELVIVGRNFDTTWELMMVVRASLLRVLSAATIRFQGHSFNPPEWMRGGGDPVGTVCLLTFSFGALVLDTPMPTASAVPGHTSGFEGSSSSGCNS